MTISINEFDNLSLSPIRRINQENWLPLIVFGVLTLGSAMVFRKWDPFETKSWIYWPIAGPLGGITSGIWHRIRGGQLGVMVKHRFVYPVVGVGISVGCGLVGTFVRSHSWNLALTFLVVALGYFVFGLLGSSKVMTIVAVAIGGCALLAGMSHTPSPQLSLVVGLLLVSSGLIEKFVD